MRQRWLTSLFERARSLWSWAIATGGYGLETSPVDRLTASALIGSKKPRKRILSNDELRSFWAATGEEGYPWQQLYRLLLLTSQRLSDVADASWPEFDFAQRIWTIPAARVKGGEADQIIPLTDQMIEILNSLPRWKYPEGDFVFSTTKGAAPVAGFSKPARRLEKRMGIGDFVIHDLRRTARTHYSALPIEEHHREMMLGHGRKGIQRVYDRYLYEVEMRRGFELWQQRLSGILNPTPDNIVSIGEARRAK